MAIPTTAQVFAEALDPDEVLDFKFDCSGLLETGETVDAAVWTLEVLAEGTALGLTIMTGGGRDPLLDDGDTSINFWLEIDTAFKTNAAFDGAGTSLPLRVTMQTTSSPSRTRQRTALVKVAQR